MELRKKSQIHHSKKWKEYIFEFFMLFLAVSSGFFMENQREHFVEHRRAEEFAHSLYEDIKKDTAALRVVLEFSHEKSTRMDSAITLLKNYPSPFDTNSFYQNIVPLMRVSTFERSGATFEQIKSSGSLRYFDLELVALLNDYDVIVKKIREREDLENTVAIQIMIPYMIDVINALVAYEIFSNAPITEDAYLKNLTQDKVDKIMNLCALSKRGRDRAITEYTKLKVKADETLIALKEKYHLE